MEAEVKKDDIEKLEELYASEGWKVLAKEIEDHKKAAEDSILNGLDEQVYYIALGHVRAYRTILAGPAILEQVRKQVETGPDIELP